MVSRWLLKIVLGIAIVGFLAIEFGSPLWTRAQLDDIAHEVADEAALELKSNGDPEKAKVAAQNTAADRDVALTAFAITDGQRVHVTVYRQARSYLLRRIDQTKDWYDISVKAEALPAQN